MKKSSCTANIFQQQMSAFTARSNDVRELAITELASVAGGAAAGDKLISNSPISLTPLHNLKA